MGEKGGLFKDINDIRALDEEPEETPEERELRKYNLNSFWGQLATNKYFESATLGVIVVNALYLGFDTDYTARNYGTPDEKPNELYDMADMPIVFPVMENLFCMYFTAEVVIRFLGYNIKRAIIKDKPYLFDLVLVIFMVAETWILAFVPGAGGALSQFSILRLLRLVRIFRMAKLMRYFPELQLIVKGMVAAVRSVGCTLVLMIGVVYVFAIIFTSEYHQGHVTDEDLADDLCPDMEEMDPALCEAAKLFGSMTKSIRHLMIMGTILDDLTAATNTIRATSSLSMISCFIAFVLISSFTLFNMLLGILCEVVEATSANEKMKGAEEHVREVMKNFFQKMDQDGDGTITRTEFMNTRNDPDVLKALKVMEINNKQFQKFADVLFRPQPDNEDPSMNYVQAVDMITRLRPGFEISALDFAVFKKKMLRNNDLVGKYIGGIERLVTELKQMDPATIKETLKGENPEDIMVLSEDDPAGGAMGGGGGGGRKKKKNGQSVKTLAQNTRIRDAYAVPTSRDRWGTSPTNGQLSSKEERQVLALDRLSDLKEKRKARSQEAQKRMHKELMQKTGSVPGSPNNNPHNPHLPHSLQLPVANNTLTSFMYGGEQNFGLSDSLRDAGRIPDSLAVLSQYHVNHGN